MASEAMSVMYSTNPDRYTVSYPDGFILVGIVLILSIVLKYTLQVYKDQVDDEYEIVPYKDNVEEHLVYINYIEAVQAKYSVIYIDIYERAKSVYDMCIYFYIVYKLYKKITHESKH